MHDPQSFCIDTYFSKSYDSFHRGGISRAGGVLKSKSRFQIILLCLGCLSPAPSLAAGILHVFFAKRCWFSLACCTKVETVNQRDGQGCFTLVLSETYCLDMRVYLLDKLLSHLTMDLRVNRYSNLIILPILCNQIMNLLTFYDCSYDL